MSHTPPSFTPVLHAAFLSLSVPTNLNVESLGQSDFKNMLTVNSIEYVFRALDKPHADALWDVAGNPIGGAAGRGSCCAPRRTDGLVTAS